MISSHDAAREQQQQRSLLSDGDQLINARRRSDSGGSYSNSNSNGEYDLDVEHESHHLNGNGHAEQKGGAYGTSRRKRSRSLWSVRVGKYYLQCPPQLNRRHKLLVFALTILALLAGCAALYSNPHGLLRPVHPPHPPHGGPPPPPGGPPPPPPHEGPPPPPPSPPPPPEEEKQPPPPPAEPPKPTFCSTWPVKKDARDVETLEQRAPVLVDRDMMDRRREAGKNKWKKPKGFKIVATVFYGRKRNTDVLDCYLQRNLVRNGGYLDEVRFMVHTKDEVDVAWVRDKAKEVDGYEFVDLGDCVDMAYGCIWEFMAEPETLFIKIDDDIVGSPFFFGPFHD